MDGIGWKNRARCFPMNHKHSVLIVDDNPNVLDVLKRILESEYSAFTCVNGQQALKIMKENDIALVIADHRMPGMKGAELLKEVREKYPNTVRLIISGYFYDQDMFMDQTNMAHAHGIIAKPWRKGELEFTIRVWIEQYERLVNLEGEARKAWGLREATSEISQQNRAEFDRAYNGMSKLENEITKQLSTIEEMSAQARELIQRSRQLMEEIKELDALQTV
jgi:response regulator RpfG family c-di-GMP phosphodiesterase